MNKKVKIPFIKNRGFECGQACTAMVIRYYRPDFEPDFEAMNQVIRHKPGKYSFPPQLAILVVYFPIDWTTLNQQTGNYAGHFVVLTGIEGDKCLIHDPDVGSYIRYPREILQKAWEHPIITDDLIVADGLK